MGQFFSKTNMFSIVASLFPRGLNGYFYQGTQCADYAK